MSRSRWFAGLLHLYPAAFRSRFGESMRFAFAEQADEARARGAFAYVGFWLRSIAHVLVFGTIERLRGLRPGSEWGHGAGADVAHAARRLSRSPGFTLAAVLTLALGIGATTAIYSVVYGVVLNPLAYPQSDRLVMIQHDAPGAELYGMGTSHGTYMHYREFQEAFEAITVYHAASLALLTDGEAQRVPGAMVGQDFFEIFLDAQPQLGRVLSNADQEVGAPRVAVISDALWRQRFGADPGIAGTSISIEGRPVEVVGVLPASFDVPSVDTQIWLPQQIDRNGLILGMFGRVGVARLKPGLTAAQAQAELERHMPTLAQYFNPIAFELLVISGGLTPLVEPMRDVLVGNVEQTLWILLGTVSFVLLIAGANVANLFLVRAEAQRREIAVRAALGAGRARIVRHHLAESLVLGALGGIGGVLIAMGAVRWLVSFGPAALPRLHEVHLSAPVLGFAVAISLVVGLVVGFVPVIRRGAGALSASIADGGRGASHSRARQRTRNALVVVQVALALMLLVGAGLMVRTFMHLQAVDPGFDADPVLVLQIGLPEALYPDRDVAMQFQSQVIDTLAALPGVTAVGATACIPLGGCDGRTPVYAENVPYRAGETPPAVDVRGTTSGYFRAMGIPLIEGRPLDPADHLREPPVALVSANLARRLWPGESPVGKRIYPDVPEEEPYTVVGMVGDAISFGLNEEPPEILYVQYNGSYSYITRPQMMTFVVRAETPPLSVAPAVRAAVRGLDPNVPVSNVRTMRSLVDDAGASTAMTMILLVTAGGFALLLGAIGVYGVLSYVVNQRRGEIGVRLALGAEAGDVRRMILRQAGSVIGVGVAVGLVGAFVLARLMAAILVGVRPEDPLTFAAVAVGLCLTALVASWLPARRAAAVDPLTALRAD